MALVLHSPATIHSARHAPSWMLLSGAAGMVNGLAFLACEQYVTHLTGAATRVGLEWPWVGEAAEFAVVALSFVAGAVASVVALHARVARGKPPLWAAPLIAVAAILGGVAAAGSVGAFGPFEGVPDTPPFVLLSLLAFATGLQNATVATATGLVVRTTHLTGPATDLGVHLGVACVTTGEARRTALRGMALRGGKVAAFVAGAALAVVLGGAAGFGAFLVPALGVLVAAGLSFVPSWGPGDYPSVGSASSPSGSQ